MKERRKEVRKKDRWGGLQFLAFLIIVLIFAQNLSEGSEVSSYIFIFLLLFGVFTYLFKFIDELKRVSFGANLLIIIAVSCIIGTLTLQRPHVNVQTEEEFIDQFVYSESSFLWKVLHPIPKGMTFSDEEETFLSIIEGSFGKKVAQKRRTELKKAKRAEFEDAMRQSFARRYSHIFRALYPMFKFLILTDIYNSWWFIFLLLLLLTNVIVCTVTRLTFRIAKLGFLLTHCGVVLFIAGAGLTTLFKETGFIPFEVGQTVSSFYDRKKGMEKDLGFAVHLKDFETEYKRELFVSIPIETGEGLRSGTAIKTSFKVSRRKKIPLNIRGESRNIEVLDLFSPEEKMDELLTEKRLAIYKGDRLLKTLDPGGEEPFIEETNLFKLRFDHAEDLEEEVKLKNSIPQGGYGSLHVKVKGREEYQCPVEEGKECVVDGFRIKVLEGYSRFVVENPVRGFRGYPSNPAVRISLEKNGKKEELLLFSNPAFRQFFKPSFEELSIYYDFPLWDGLTDRWFRVILNIETGKATLVTYSRAGRDEKEIDSNSSTPLPVDSYRISFVSEKRWRVRLRLTDGEGKNEVLLSEGETMRWGDNDGLILLNFDENLAKMPEAWKSRLEIIEGGKVVKDAVVEVNHPLRYRGYGFYQFDADPTRPTYSGIQVIKDPGWFFTLPGLLLILGGIFYNSFVRPIILRSSI